MVAIGVLALQGAYHAHRFHVEAAGAKYLEVLTAQDLCHTDGLILPGGESGSMLKMMGHLGLYQPLHEYLRTRPAWGICAGAILLAKSVQSPAQKSFAAIDIDVQRNAYGRQKDSFQSNIDSFRVSFIRAPQITRWGPSVQVLQYWKNSAVSVISGSCMATTFHPELNSQGPSPWHQKFIEIVQGVCLQ